METDKKLLDGLIEKYGGDFISTMISEDFTDSFDDNVEDYSEVMAGSDNMEKRLKESVYPGTNMRWREWENIIKFFKEGTYMEKEKMSHDMIIYFPTRKFQVWYLNTKVDSAAHEIRVDSIAYNESRPGEIELITDGGKGSIYMGPDVKSNAANLPDLFANWGDLVYLIDMEMKQFNKMTGALGKGSAYDSYLNLVKGACGRMHIIR